MALHRPARRTDDWNFPGYLSNAFITLGGRQVIVLINATGSTLTVQQNAELGDALSAGLCGDL